MEVALAGSTDEVGFLLVLFSAMFLLLSTILWVVIHRRQQDGSMPSGPKCWPIFGSLFEVLYNFERMHDWLTDYFVTGALTFRMRAGGQTILFTADPAVCEHILKSNFPNYPKGEVFHTNMEPLLGDGILNTDGEMWKKQRKSGSLEFSSKVFRDFSSVVHQSNALALASLVTPACFDHKSLEMQDLFMRLTLDSICKVAFGVDVGSLSPLLPDVPFARAFEQASRNCSNRFVDPLWKLKRRFHLGAEAALPRLCSYLDDFTYQIIRTRRAELEAVANSNRLSQDEKPTRADLLSRLMLLSESLNDGKVSKAAADKALRHSVLNFILAGRDTTASTLSWFMYCLCNHPEVGDKIYEEVCAFERKQQRTGGDVSLESLDETELNKLVEEFVQLLGYESIVSSFEFACCCD